jgi:hypothetical protein
LSDHFQHQDHSISRINFLRYSESQWQRIAGNEFAYCNRLRASDFLRLFDDLGFEISRREAVVDGEAMRALREGTVGIDAAFLNYGQQDLCSVSLRVMLGLKN